MSGLIMTAFMIYDLFGGWGAFHWAAVAALGTLIGGLVSVMGMRREGWVMRHATWMSWSYVGLLAAFVAESMTRWLVPPLVPLLSPFAEDRLFWPAVGIGSVLVIATGAWIISRTLLQAVSSVERTDARRLSEP
jgi:hypothetical protein